MRTITTIVILFISLTASHSPNFTTAPSQMQKIKIGSLVNEGVSNTDSRITLGSKNNLDVIYGFRRLKFKTRFESIDFGNSEIDNRYKSKGIVKVHVRGVNIALLGKNDDLYLTFCNNELSEITMYNNMEFKRDGSRQSSHKEPDFNTEIGDLTEFYGRATQKPRNKNFMPSDFNWDVTDQYEWRTNKILLTYSTGSRGFLIDQNIWKVREYASICFELLENKEYLIKSIDFIDKANDADRDKRINDALEKTYRKKF